MRVIGALHQFDRYLVPPIGAANAWVTTLGATVAVALGYFWAAELGLALLAKPSGVAVFWPASGIAAGLLVAAGRRAGVAVVMGVVVGTVAANLMSDRHLVTSVLNGLSNAGEAVLVAWLLDRWFGRPFNFGDIRRVIGFFAAAAIATAVSAIGGALTMTTFHASAPFFDVWRTWFLSDAVGIVVVAPLLIALSQLKRELPTRAELIEWGGVLALTVLTSIYALSAPTGSWLSFDPDAIVFPLLLWLAIRNQLFAIAGALAVSLVAIGATTFGIGHFGDANLSIVERALGAQLLTTVVTAFTLVLTALFAERKASEQGLRESEERLRLAQLKTGVGIWDRDARTGKLVWTPQLEAIYGLQPGSVTCYADFRDRVHPDDIARIEALQDAAVRQRQETFALEFRIIRPDGQVRWISAVVGAVYDEATGEPVRLLGNNTDITERKLSEQALAERNAQLALAGKAARVGSYAYDPGQGNHADLRGLCGHPRLSRGDDRNRPLRVPRQPASRGRPSEQSLPGTKRSAIGGASTAWSIVSVALTARFAGSRHAVSFPMTAGDVRIASLVSASTTRSASRPRPVSPSATPNSTSRERLRASALLPSTMRQKPCSCPTPVRSSWDYLRALPRSPPTTGMHVCIRMM